MNTTVVISTSAAFIVIAITIGVIIYLVSRKEKDVTPPIEEETVDSTTEPTTSGSTSVTSTSNNSSTSTTTATSISPTLQIPSFTINTGSTSTETETETVPPFVPGFVNLYTENVSSSFKDVIANYSNFVTLVQDIFACKVIAPALDCLTFEKNVQAATQEISAFCDNNVETEVFRGHVRHSLTAAYKTTPAEENILMIKEQYGINLDGDEIANNMISSITELIVSMYIYACKGGSGSRNITDILMDIKMTLCKNATREPKYTKMCRFVDQMY